MIDFRLLQYFLVAAEEGNITRAAQRIHITQPSLSRQLAALESELGRKLYTRESNGIKLTDEGLLLKKRAHELLDLEAKTRDEITSCGENITGTVYIGAGETIGVKYIADILLKLRKKYPDVKYRMISGDSEDVSDKLDRGLIDFGVFVGKVDLNKYDSIMLPNSDKWGVIMRSDDDLARKKFITPKDLRGRKLLFSHQAKSQGEFSEWLGYSIDELDIIGTHNLVYNASIMVREGLGVLVTIEGIIGTECDSGLRFVELKPEIRAGLILGWKMGAVFSKAANKFLEIARFHNKT